MAAKLRKGDKVIVLTGKDKGKQGEILTLDPATGKATVQGVNISIRHTAQTQQSQGGRVPTEMPIQLSNLSFIDPKEGGATRIGFKVVDGKKVRVAKKSGEVIDG